MSGEDQGLGRELSEIRARGDLSQLEVWRKIQRVGQRPGNYRSETIATFELRYLEDTAEVALLRRDNENSEWECVYSDSILAHALGFES